MCRVVQKFDFDLEFEGYKACIQPINDNSKIYSPWTGIEYKVGKVPTEWDQNWDFGHLRTPWIKGSECSTNYSEPMIGSTGLLEHVDDVRKLINCYSFSDYSVQLRSRIKVLVVKFKGLGDKLGDLEYQLSPIKLIHTITSIEVLPNELLKNEYPSTFAALQRYNREF